MRVGAADLVDTRNRFIRRLDEEVEELHLVQHAEGAALLARSVVGQQHDHRVVGDSEGLERVHESADLIVGVVEECGVGLLEAAGQTTLVVGEIAPGLDAWIAWGQFGVVRNHTEFLLTSEPPFAPHVPTLVEDSAVLREVLRRGLMRSMGGSERQVHEEGPVGTHTHRVVHEFDGLVDQIFTQVIAVLRATRRFDPVVVVDQFGVELVGLTVEEPVEPIESALQRPLIERSGGRAIGHRTEVPLTECERGVPGVSQHLGDRCRVVGDVAPHVRIAGVEVGDRAHTDRVVITPGQQRRPRGRTQWSHVEVGEAQPLVGQTVDVRRVDG